ncbi:MAG TPA: hypothetical protein VGM32_00735 [Rhodopila sp.]
MRRPPNLMKTVTAPEPVRATVEAGPPANYLDLYGLSKPPFGDALDSTGYILFPPHRRPFELLIDHMLNRNGVVLLTGEEGIGKTETLRSATAVAAESGLQTIMVSRPPEGRISLEQLKSAFDGGPEAFHQAPRKALLVEDVELLPDDCLTFLLSLARETRDEPIVLTGSGADLSRPDLAELVGLARNTIRLLRLGSAEIRQYIERSLWIAGGTTRRLITPDAMKLVIARSGGVPGTVNRVMEAVLTAGFARGDTMITAKTVDSVLGPPAPRPRPRAVKREPSSVTSHALQIVAGGLLVTGVSVFLYKGLSGISEPAPPAPAKPVGAVQSHPEPPPAKPADALPPALMTVLIKRGNESLDLGDIAAARLLFQRAAEGGNAAAATALGKTYDPNFVTSPSSRDPARAAEWYQRAVALGDPGAADLLKRIAPR